LMYWDDLRLSYLPSLPTYCPYLPTVPTYRPYPVTYLPTVPKALQYCTALQYQQVQVVIGQQDNKTTTDKMIK